MSTTVVRIRKAGGAEVVRCDLYIGPRVHNSSWKCEQSEWWADRSAGDHETWLAQRPDLVRRLPELEGLTLGCLCPNTLTCHGHVLARACRGAAAVEELEGGQFERGRFIFFKGGHSPFSNFHDAPLRSEQGLSFPHGGLQYYAFLKAKDAGACDLSNQIMKADSIYHVQCLLQQLDGSLKGTGRPWKSARTLEVIKQIVSAKYRGDPEFRRSVDGLSLNTIPCEATDNTFFACGVDLKVLLTLDPLEHSRCMRGENVLGWSIWRIKLLTSCVDDHEKLVTYIRGIPEDCSLSPILRRGFQRVLHQEVGIVTQALPGLPQPCRVMKLPLTTDFPEGRLELEKAKAAATMTTTRRRRRRRALPARSSPI